MVDFAISDNVPGAPRPQDECERLCCSQTRDRFTWDPHALPCGSGSAAPPRGPVSPAAGLCWDNATEACVGREGRGPASALAQPPELRSPRAGRG